MKKLLAVLLAAVMMICFAACGTEPEEETLEGYAYEFSTGTRLPEDVQSAFSKATEGLDGVNYEPIAYLGSQVVAGLNYAVICKGTTVTEKPETKIYIMIIYSGLEGEAEIVNIEEFDFTKLSDKGDDAGLAGGWEVTKEEVSLDELSAKEFNAKAGEYGKCTLEALALLGIKTEGGTVDYAYAARGVKDGDLNKLFVVIIGTNSDGSKELRRVSEFSIADYNKQAEDAE